MLFWRSRWRVIASSSEARPNTAQIIISSFGPRGTMRRVFRMLVWRSAVMLGQIVIAAPDHEESNSRTKSSTLSSFSLSPSR